MCLFRITIYLVILADQWFQEEREDIVILWSRSVGPYAAIIIA